MAPPAEVNLDMLKEPGRSMGFRLSQGGGNVGVTAADVSLKRMNGGVLRRTARLRDQARTSSLALFRSRRFVEGLGVRLLPKTPSWQLTDLRGFTRLAD